MTELREIRRQFTGAMLQTRRPLAGARAGQFRVRVRGAGSDLDQLRDYQPGDDVRFIDWKSSARMQKIVVREYRDEQSRLVHIVCDQSRSMDFGVGARRMRDCAADVATALAVLCENAGDACGLLLAGDRLSERLKPASGSQQTARIAAAFLSENPAELMAEPPARSLGQWCAELGAQNLRASLLFIISDFIGDFDKQFTKYALSLARRHVLVAVRIRDESERSPYQIGRSWLLRDSEILSPDAQKLRLETLSDGVSAAKALEVWRRKQEHELVGAGFLPCDCFTDRPLATELSVGLRRWGLFTGRKK